MKKARDQALRRQTMAEDAFARHSMRDMDVKQLLLDKIEQKTKGGAYNLLRAFRKFDTSSDTALIDLDQFQRCLERFGLDGIPRSEVKKLFDSYDTGGDGTINFQEFVGGVMGSYAAHNSLQATASTEMIGQHGRDSLRQRQKIIENDSWRTLTVDVEQLLLDKIEQKTKGGPYSLLRAFRKFDTKGNDNAIDFGEFKRCVEMFGLSGVPEEAIRKLFNKFDQDGAGKIDFKEFVSGVMKSHASQNSIRTKGDGMMHMERAREVSEKRRRAAEKRHWQTLHVNVEKVLLEKIEQRTKGGPGQLRRAFRKFDLGSSKTEISFPEFKSALLFFGMHELPEEDTRKLFDKYDVSGDGTINYEEFVAGVMQSGLPQEELYETDSDYESEGNEPKNVNESKTSKCTPRGTPRKIPPMKSKSTISKDKEIRKLLAEAKPKPHRKLSKSLSSASSLKHTPRHRLMMAKAKNFRNSQLRRQKYERPQSHYLRRRSKPINQSKWRPPTATLRRARSAGRFRDANNEYTGPRICSHSPKALTSMRSRRSWVP